MRPAITAPVPWLAAILLLAAGPVRAGIIPPEPPPPLDLTPAAVLYSSEIGVLFLVPSDFGLDDLDEELLPFDFRLVPLDDLSHGSADAFAVTQICLTDPLCHSKILGSGPGGRLPLADALVESFETDFPFDDGPGQPVPEPNTAALLGLALCALGAARRTRLPRNR